MNKHPQAARTAKQFCAILFLVVGASLAGNAQQYKSTCTLSDMVPIDGNANELSGTDLVIGEINGSRYPIQGLCRAELFMMDLPPVPTGFQFAGATLRVYLQSNTGNAGNASFSSLSLYHCPHLPHPNITVSLTDYADTNFVLVTNSLVTPNSPPGQYYEIDVTAHVAKAYQYASDEIMPVSVFRFQVDGLQYMGGSHYYEFDPAGGNYPPGLILLFSGDSIPIRPMLNIQKISSTLVLSWPNNYSDFVLESADSSTLQTWETVTNQPIATNDQFKVSIEAAAPQRFFRLRQQ